MKKLLFISLIFCATSQAGIVSTLKEAILPFRNADAETRSAIDSFNHGREVLKKNLDIEISADDFPESMPKELILTWYGCGQGMTQKSLDQFPNIKIYDKDPEIAWTQLERYQRVSWTLKHREPWTWLASVAKYAAMIVFVVYTYKGIKRLKNESTTAQAAHA
jgi:hypothetical protein